MIPSVNYDQHEILRNILSLSGLQCFDADLSYGNGGFYRDMPEPRHRFDIDAALPNLTAVCSSTETPLQEKSVRSAVFDPPFLTYVRAARHGNGDMVLAKRFGGYWRYDELETHYRGTLREAARILEPKGVLVFKCQDIVHNHRLHLTHTNVVDWGRDWFRVKDLFILPAKHRMPIPQQKNTRKKQQRHARIFHSYFVVLERSR